ncbi:uncharacterized protein LOC111708160 [Eurytemora carolleeae]|uniref:uncharacterized protein LOC111708160 n=1 Tax=Eurytemora carolleeae TaxID=1294199 RepID=UPI000C7650E2|nr:uncharacterized protein LOC111708160 [Eurytemora carolleeae]|eukprot:XP_023337219.1 uncharacterized protein LOC111708160 [Eurytemora affinis]
MSDYRYVQLTMGSRKFEYRDLFGQIYEGAWIPFRETVVFKLDSENKMDQCLNHNIRIAYNNYEPMLKYNDNKLDLATYEGYFLHAFIERYELMTEFIFANDSWGVKNTSTGTWPFGVVSLVGFGHADLGTGFISYSSERLELISYTHPVGLDDVRWITKFPGKKSPMNNIIKVFDRYTWIGIIVSTVTASIVLLGVVNILRNLGFKQPDNISAALIPLSLMNAEPMPDWFLVSTTRVYSGSILMLVWGLCSAVLTYAFSGNLRAMVLTPAFETPIDTAQQIVENNLMAQMGPTDLVYSILNSSSNPWQVAVLDNTIPWTDWSERIEMTQSGVVVTYGTEDYFLNSVKKDPTLSKMKSPVFYVSKEAIRVYYAGWILQKNSKWQNFLDNHILICNQAGFSVKIKNYLREVTDEDNNSQSQGEKMRVEHVAVAFIILGIGLICSTLGMDFLD